jgi:phage head maturation protease
VNVFDVSPVTYPAYTGTDVAAREARATFDRLQGERQARIQRLLRRVRLYRALRGEA